MYVPIHTYTEATQSKHYIRQKPKLTIINPLTLNQNKSMSAKQFA